MLLYSDITVQIWLFFFNIHLSDDLNNGDKYTVHLNCQRKFRSTPDKITVDQISNLFLVATLSEALFVFRCAATLYLDVIFRSSSSSPISRF